MSAKFLQIGPKLVDIAFVDRAGRNYDLFVFRNLYVFAAQLLGRDPPPEIRFEDAATSMSPMALSFWQNCRRVRNDKLKRELGVTLDYPTYREGLNELFEATQTSLNADSGP